MDKFLPLLLCLLFLQPFSTEESRIISDDVVLDYDLIAEVFGEDIKQEWQDKKPRNPENETVTTSKPDPEKETVDESSNQSSTVSAIATVATSTTTTSNKGFSGPYISALPCALFPFLFRQFFD